MSQEQNQSPSDRRDKIDGENTTNKNMKTVELLSNPGQGQGQELNVEEASINDLPPEMLVEILKCLDTRSLFALRLVNRNLNSIASSVLCHRPDARVRFEFREKNKFRLMLRQGRYFRPVDNNLKDFVFFMKKSKNVPYAHFAFEISRSSIATQFFDNPNFKAFLKFFSSSESSSSQNSNSDPDQTIKGLHLKFPNVLDGSGIIILGAQFGDLLLNQVPLLENLSLEFEMPAPGSANVKLFPFSNQNQHQKPVEINPGQLAVPVPIESKFQLPHLKTLRFTCPYTADYFQILQDLLKAAVNLKSLYLHETNIFVRPPITIQEFEVLQSLGKFQLLKNLRFHLNAQFLSLFKDRPDFAHALFNLEVEELNLGIHAKYRDPNNDDHKNATNILSRLFDSCKNSLKKLEMEPLGAFAALKLPTFKSLTELKQKKNHDADYPIFFPPGVRALDIFPAVRDLDLPKKWIHGFPEVETIPVFPMVKSLSVVDKGFKLSCISTMTLLCPNLKHLRIHTESYDHNEFVQPKLEFLLVAPEIWRLMTQLESLEVDITVDPEDEPAELDSCFTGISVDRCERLYRVRELNKSLEKFGGEPKPELESRLAAVREHPSILDMKCLTKLTINLYEEVSSDDYRVKKVDCKRFYKRKLTWISHEHAFKLLPQLKLN